MVHCLWVSIGRWNLWTWLVLLWILGGAACGRAPETTGVEECVELMEARRFDEAVETCDAAHQGTADPRAALAMARIQRTMGEHEESLRWVETLRGTTLEAEGYGVAAGSLRQQGKLEDAEDAYRRQLDLYAKAGNHHGIADGHYGLFYLAWQGSRFSEAEEHARRSLEGAILADDRSAAARASRAMFSLHYDLGDLQRASAILEEAEGWIDDADQGSRARHLALKGAVQLDHGRHGLASGLILQAIDLARDEAVATALGLSFFRSNYLNLTKASLALQDPASAREHLEAAKGYVDPRGARPPAALAFYGAQVAAAEGQLGAARGLLEEALAADPSDDWAWDLHLLLGEIHRRSGDLEGASSDYKRSIDVLEGMRRRLVLDELKTWLLEKKRRPYEHLFEVQLEMGHASAALATVEQAKARAFLDAFIRNAQSATAVHEASQVDAATVDSPTAGTLSDRHAVLADLLPSIDATPLVDHRRVDALLETLGQRSALVYFRVEDAYWRLEVAAGVVTHRRLEGTAEAIDQRVRRFLARPDDDALAEGLGGLLLPPNDPAIPSREAASNWIIIPDGALSSLSFAALQRGGRRVVEARALQYLPSLTALQVIEERPRHSGGQRVILADPMGNLPAAAREGVEVGKILGVRPSTGAAARRALLPLAEDGELLHLASHTGLAAEGPWLELADGRLQAQDILAGGFGADVVVLAGCASGAHRSRGLWGSLGATFLASGGDAVVVALWSIDDDATRRFINRFYEEGGAREPVTALASTQRAWIEAGEEVMTWAPFAVIGSQEKSVEIH